jgi:hypothetical protein
MVKRLLAAVLFGLVPMPALSDGMEIPRIVRPTLGGDYVLRTELFTTNAVTKLQYDAFYVTDDGRIGEPIPGTDNRPKEPNTRAGQKKRVLVRIPGEAIDSEQLLAVCMWRDPEVLNDTGSSAMVASFRYCRLFTAQP